MLGKELIIFLFHKQLSKSILFKTLNPFGKSQAEVVTLRDFFTLDVIKPGECLKYLKPYLECEENN